MSSSYDQDVTSASGSHWSNVALESFKGGSHSTMVYHLIIFFVIMVMSMIMIMTVLILMNMIMMVMIVILMIMINL